MKLFIHFFAFLFLLNACNADAQKTNLSVNEFEKAISEKNIQILDVRTAGEYYSGHIQHALQADWTKENEFAERTKSLNKNVPVYTYCLSGGRSGAAMDWLNAHGYKAYNLSGGINAWKAEHKPLENATPVKQITLQEYLSQIPSDKTVLVDFGAVWCPPCKKMTPVLDSLSGANPHFKLIKIDGGQQTEILRNVKVQNFPTFIIYKGGKEVWRKEGIVSAEELADNL